MPNDTMMEEDGMDSMYPSEKGAEESPPETIDEEKLKKLPRLP